MKQVLQDLGSGETLLVDAPVPAVQSGGLLIATRASLLSLGTERMLLEFGQANLLQKALQQPERVRQVFAKVKSDGLLPTWDAVRSKLAQPIAMGYCNAGIVLQVGTGVSGFEAGDRVVSNGPHAEVVSVPANLCAKIPPGVTDEQAPFAVVGAIALQGIRLLQPTLGECFVVTGLGLIGLLAVQLLRAHGARVLGVDPDRARCALAEQFGAQACVLQGPESLEHAAQVFSEGRGVDGVLVTASTDSSDPINQGARVCRQRARIVQVGATGLHVQRAEFYRKELSLQVSCSYGPGRYDPEYEQKGLDYPLGYVRWTAQRNFEAVLQQMAAGQLSTEPLLSHRYDIAAAADAYGLVLAGGATGILLGYQAPLSAFAHGESRRQRVAPAHSDAPAPSGSASPAKQLVLGVLGAGNFAQRVLLPALDKAPATLLRKAIVSQSGVSSALAARRFGFEWAASSEEAVLGDSQINTVLIATQHHLHAEQVLAALRAGKHVFVEKPLCLRPEQVDQIALEAGRNSGVLLVGYNRRFAPLVREMKQRLDEVGTQRSMIYVINAGAIESEHWTQDPARGGGRLVGEACHFIDLLRFLAGSPISAASVKALPAVSAEPRDTFSIDLQFADGSMGTIHYFANGHRAFPKERLTVFSGGRVLELDNFRSLTGHGFKELSSKRTFKQDKGHRAEVHAFLDAALRGGPGPIPLAELLEVSRVSLALAAGEQWSGG